MGRVLAPEKKGVQTCKAGAKYPVATPLVQLPLVSSPSLTKRVTFALLSSFWGLYYNEDRTMTKSTLQWVRLVG